MSTPRKEELNETSDPVLQNSGEVSQVVKEKKEISLQDVLNVINAKFDRVDAKFDQVNTRLTDVKTDTANLMVRMEVMENRMAVQEARMTPPRSRAPSQESVKELKTEVSVVEVSGRFRFTGRLDQRGFFG